MKVNEKVRQLREDNNLSQEDMALKLQMSTNGYAKLERGESHFSIPRLEQIATVFGIDILELMSIGERNIVLYSQENNNSSFNTMGSHDNDVQNAELKLALTYKDEIIKSKDLIIAAQQSEIESLKTLVDMYKGNK